MAAGAVNECWTMDDGRYIVSFSSLNRSDPQGQMIGLTNGVHQSQLIQPTTFATQPGQFASQTHSYPVESSTGLPSLQIGYGNQQQGYSGAQNTQYLYPTATQPVFQDIISSSDVGEAGYFKTTIPTGVFDSNHNVQATPHIHTVELVDDVINADVTSSAALGVTSGVSSGVASGVTSSKAVRNKVKPQGQTANDAVPVTKRKQKGKNSAVPKEKVDSKTTNKKQQKQKVDNSKLRSKETKTPQPQDIEVVAYVHEDPIESGSKQVRRKPKLMKQQSVVTDIFVEQVQSAREAQDSAKLANRRSKVAQVVSTGDAEPEAIAEPLTAVPEHNPDHTLTRVRVVHVTPDGTNSIRPVDAAKKKPPNVLKKPTVFKSSIQTQTDSTEEQGLIPHTGIIRPSSNTDLYSFPQSRLSTGQVQTDSISDHLLAETRRTSHVDPDQVVWTAGITQTMEQGVGDTDSMDDSRQRKRTSLDNTYATIIKPYGQSNVILLDEQEPEQEEPEAPPPVPNKTQEAFEKIYNIQEPSQSTPAEEVKLHIDELTPTEADQLAASLDQIAFVGTNEGEEQLHRNEKHDDDDPYSTISEVPHGTNYATSGHGTLSSSGTGHSVDSDGTESTSDRILRVAKEMRDNGEADVYENISAVRSKEQDTAEIDEANSDTQSEDDVSSPQVQTNGETLQNGAPELHDDATTSQQNITTSESAGAIAMPSPADGTAASPPQVASGPFSLPIAFKVNDKFTVYFHRCDITRLKTDVIVSAANSKLKPDHGVAKAIAKAAGSDLEKDSKKYVKKNGVVEVGDVVSTKPGKLQCGYVFHAVGPKYKDFKDKNACKDKLRQTYDKIFEVCWRHKVPSVAIPPISAGKFGVPNQFISSCIYESLFTAAMKPDQLYTKDVHIVNLEPAIILSVAEAVATRPAHFKGKQIKVEQMERREVRRVLEQRVIRKKSSSSSKSKDSKKSSNGSKSRDEKVRDDKSRDAKSHISKSSTGSSNKDGSDTKL